MPNPSRCVKPKCWITLPSARSAPQSTRQRLKTAASAVAVRVRANARIGGAEQHLMIRAIVFDFDGLILDTELPQFQSWQAIYQTHGCTLPFAVWATCIGTTEAFDPYIYLEEQLGRAVDRTAMQLQQRQQCDALIAAQAVLP